MATRTDIQYLGNILQASLCNLYVEECRRKLLNFEEKTTSPAAKARSESKRILLDELIIMKRMPLDVAYDEYIGMIPKQHEPHYKNRFTAKQAFVRSIMNAHSGLPVIIIKCEHGRSMLVLFDKVGDEKNLQNLRIIDNVLAELQPKGEKKLVELCSYYKSFMKLILSAREKAVAIAMLAVMFSATELRNHLGIHEDVSVNLKKAILQITEESIVKEDDAREKAEEKWNQAVKMAELKLQEMANTSRIDEKENLFKDVEIKNRQTQLKSMKQHKTRITRQIAARSVKVWKQTLFSQKGKNKGIYQIDRGAEMAVFQALQEQLVAHKNRTDVPQLEGRLHVKDLQNIANEWLEKEGKRTIKSKETVRSWARPKNKRSNQSKQHRGQGLFRFKKPNKKYSIAHINMHYNRAHIKQYTRFTFSKHGQRQKYEKYTVRRCMDDKAYLKCGTSEGFSRPRTRPIMVGDHEGLELPIYDFPEEAGYVSPGVNLIIKSMNEVEHQGRDVFALNGATISVTCKPKILNPSTATQWANDIYADRLNFPEEHGISTGLQTDIPREVITAMVFLKDSLTQFKMMNIAEDYKRILDGKDFQCREKLRVSVLIKRLLYVDQHIRLIDVPEIIQLRQKYTELLLSLQKLELYLFESKMKLEDVLDKFEDIGQQVVILLQLYKDTAITPEHRPIDFQTTDAGPGVSTNEQLVRLRLTESFIINDLDFQVRFHYAPRDSKCHKVEQVMSTLNEACGDGRFIDVSNKSVMDSVGEAEMLQKAADFELQKLREEMKKDAAKECAQKVANRYQGSKCMGTVIHSGTPGDDPYHNFFFDETYLLVKQCSQAKSQIAKAKVTGMAYYMYLLDMEKCIYVKYNNGIEGIRSDENFRCPFPIQRMPAPVPKPPDNTGFHYYRYNEIPATKLEDRQTDDYNPIVQLKKYMENIGDPDIISYEEDGAVVVRDKNETWQRVTSGLDTFCDTFCGSDLSKVLKKEAESIYMQKLRKASKQLQKFKVNLTEEKLSVIKTGILKIQIKKQSIPPYLPWGGTCADGVRLSNTCTIDNSLYLFHVYQTFHHDFTNFCRDSDDVILNTLYRIHTLFGEGEFAQGKLMWLNLFSSISIQDGGIDCFGSEDEYFYIKMHHFTQTAFTSTCNNPECMMPVSIQSGRIISYPMKDQCSGKTLSKALSHWIKNKRSKQCTKGNCTGRREHGKRYFVNGVPPVLPLDVSNCPWAITPNLQLCDFDYILAGVSYSRGAHFVSHIKIPQGWLMYDGLQGNKKVPSRTTPSRCHMSHALYIKTDM